ncbi:DUF4844 domain-containing protein [Duganella sp. P38]|uniref:DUF4844 domain-containing protein n=1 Tax=Duganella sp. P38 TaxID=3423949 RepID=UPI003D798F11
MADRFQRSSTGDHAGRHPALAKLAGGTQVRVGRHHFYPGARNEEQRRVAQAAVDGTLQALIAELPERPQRSTVLRAMKRSLADFNSGESEERDQLLAYFGKVLDICGIQTSAELFNVWRYGFPYGWLI